MVSETIINGILKSASESRKNDTILMFINNMRNRYLSDDFISHILEILLDENKIIKTSDIDIEYVKNNLNLLMYNSEKYDIQNIEVKSIDNIECSACISFIYIEKEKLDTDLNNYISNTTNVNFVYHPELLKNS